MTTKSKLQQDAEALTDEQFAEAERAFAAAKAARGNSEEFNRRVANMTDGEFEKERSKYR